jgi:tetratricopeptide (TPR) repeat protein
VGLADTYNLLGAQHSVMAPRDSLPKARAAALRALEIDEKLAEAYASLGFIKFCFEWDWQAAEQNYLKAIELKPNYATAHHWYGELLSSLGRFDEAYSELLLAQELDPLSLAINVDTAACFYYSRQYSQSERQIVNLLELNSNFIRAYMLLGKVQEQAGEHAKAVATLKQAVELSEDDPVSMSALAHALATAGERDEANRILDDLQGSADRRYVSAGNIAAVHIALGNTDLAFAFLEQAHENRDIELVWLKVSPVFDPLRTDARFVDLVRRVNPSLLG